jgi:hypothetical protein
MEKSERLKRQFAKIVKAVCRTMDLRIDGDQEKIDRFFDEYNEQSELPEGLKLTSRFDTIEELAENRFKFTGKKYKELEEKVDDYIGRPWWRRFLGIEPKKKMRQPPLGVMNPPSTPPPEIRRPSEV